MEGELAWIEARVEQLEATLDGDFFESVRILSKEVLCDRLNAQFLSDFTFKEKWRKIEFHFLSFPDSFDHLDDIKYSLYMITNTYQILQSWGLAYPRSMSRAHVETRWTLDIVDGMNPILAEQAAHKLVQ